MNSGADQACGTDRRKDDPFPDLNAEESAALLGTLVQEHAERTAERILERMGGPLAQANLTQYLNDESCVRYPAEVVFDDAGLEPNQFGEPFMSDEDGRRICKIHIHPRFEHQPDLLPFFVAYLTPLVNYGPLVSSDICEAFGAQITGQEQDVYYAILCRAVDGGW